MSIFFTGYRDPPDLHSFPTRRSSDLLLCPAALPRHAPQADVAGNLHEDQRVADAVPARLEQDGGVQHHQRRSEEHTSELQSLRHLVCRLLLEKKKKENKDRHDTQTKS